MNIKQELRGMIKGLDKMSEETTSLSRRLEDATWLIEDEIDEYEIDEGAPWT